MSVLTDLTEEMTMKMLYALLLLFLAGCNTCGGVAVGAAIDAHSDTEHALAGGTYGYLACKAVEAHNERYRDGYRIPE